MGTPKISIVTVNKNGGKYLKNCIEGILAQTYTSYEHIIVDGKSDDNSIEILKSYSHVKWISEPDRNEMEAFRKGFKLASGDYIMITTSTDVYIGNTWLERCVKILDNDNEISLVWGSGLYINEDNDIIGYWRPDLFKMKVPNKNTFLPFWLSNRIILPELNYCVRRNVFIDCMINNPIEIFGITDSFILFEINFNLNGYLTYYLPMIAHGGRIHSNQLSEQRLIAMNKSLEIRRNLLFKKIASILLKPKHFKFKDGNNESILKYQINRYKFAKEIFVNYLKKIIYKFNQIKNVN